MKKLVFSALFMCTFVAQGLFADYCFPSPNPPAGKDPSEIKQYVTIIWDDNAYSGLEGTPYETEAWCEEKIWDNMGRVGGKVPFDHEWVNPDNPDAIEEADMGLSWAVYNLAGTRSNPDGSDIHFTFNVISGQMCTVYGCWDSLPEENTQVGYAGGSFMTIDWASLPEVVERWAPSCWGREYAVYVGDGESDGSSLHGSVSDFELYGWKDEGFEPGDHLEWDQPNWTQYMYQVSYDAGHEIGNHTIDHMESNSGLPPEVWPNDGEGFDSCTGEDNPSGIAEQYDTWDVIGWNENAGKVISVECWADAIQLGEDVLEEYLEISVANGNLFAFRAPRLELNGNMFFALKEKGYLYDCGLEEGYEMVATMGKQLWPYTTDNGSPNAWLQTEYGEPTQINTLPTGIWEIPVNVVQIPEEYIEEVKRKAHMIDDAAFDGGDLDLEGWDGKITGFDFNMYILYGMNRDEWFETMKANLDAHIAGNKAPLQIGAHTDYYSMMYDRATLINEINLESYGLNITEGWNNYQDRIEGLEQFVDYALDEGAYFVSGKELIDEIKIMQEDEVFGEEADWGAMSWIWFCDESLNSSTSIPESFGGIWNAHISVDKADGGNYPLCGYALYEYEGFFAGMTHISLTYKSSAPLALRLLFNNDKPWEVLLNNLDQEIFSGKIPMEAFRYNQYQIGENSTFDPKDIYGIEVQVLTPALEVENHVVSITEIMTYGAFGPINAVTTAKAGINKFGLVKFSKNSLVFNAATAGKYDISIVGANGRTIQSFNKITLKAGLNNLKLNNLTSGVYLMKISGQNMQKSFKSTIL